MAARGPAVLLVLALALLAFVPTGAGLPAWHVVPSATANMVPRPVFGTVSNCTTRVTCAYVFNNSRGTGWANNTFNSTSAEQMAIQLPGEAKASYNLSYSSYIARLNGTYTYWTIGSFLGTDVNSGNVVYGTTNTNFTITCHGHSGRGGGCTYTYTTDNGTIEVKFTNAEITSTSISCSPTITHPGGKVSCTVLVSNGWNVSNVPNGTVRISDGRTGTLSDKGTCALVNGGCSFVYRPSDNTCGTVSLTATYRGNPAFYKSATSIPIAVVVSGGC